MQWDNTMCLILNCREILRSITLCQLYWQKSDKYKRHGTLVANSYLSVHIRFSNVWRMRQPSFASRKNAQPFFPCLARMRQNGSVTSEPIRLRIKLVTRTYFRICSNNPRELQNLYEQEQKRPKNHCIDAPLMVSGASMQWVSDLSKMPLIQGWLYYITHYLCLFADVGYVQIKKNILYESPNFNTCELYMQSLTWRVAKILQRFSLAASLSN